MADTIHYRFTVRGGTAAALEARNEVPLARELVVESDTGKMKLGDGALRYNELPYLSSSGGTGWLRGAGAPSAELGADGSFYLNDTNADVYAKAADAWTKVGSIAGGGGGGGIAQIIPGANVSIDNSDPTKPIVSASGSMGPDGPTGPAGPRGGGLITDTESLANFDLGGIAGQARDEVAVGVWMLNGGAVIDASQKKIGDASLHFPSTGAMVLAPGGALYSVESNFTIEVWTRRSSATRCAIWGGHGGSSSGWYAGINADGSVYAVLAVGSFQTITTAVGDAPVGGWVHIAFVRAGGRFCIYVNGVKKSDEAITGTLRNVVGNKYLGRESNSAPADRRFIGHMDEFRWSTKARYTADFTPQTTPFAVPVAPQMSAYTVATLPPADVNAYVTVFVTDLAGGAEPCISDGTNWRRFSDRGVAS